MMVSVWSACLALCTLLGLAYGQDKVWILLDDTSVFQCRGGKRPLDLLGPWEPMGTLVPCGPWTPFGRTH